MSNHLSPERLAAVRFALATGASLSATARQTGVSLGAVTRRARLDGIRPAARARRDEAAPHVCDECARLRALAAETIHDYDLAVLANLRLVLWIKAQGLDVPDYQDLRARYPLPHHTGNADLALPLRLRGNGHADASPAAHDPRPL